ncbi:MAG: IS4 family transposase [Thermonemataceae bacterium]|nr:IS4 family transposase [Thermonemataceae bacterium]
MLLTNIAVNSFSQALERIEWYCLRWQIEVYHKLIKSGCRVEDCLLETADRLKRYLALMCVIAWRLFWLTYLKRQHPDSSCTTFLTQAEWQVLYCKINNTLSLPLNPPTVSQAVTWIAQLGGFLARKHDGEPGITVIWRGWQRLQSFVDIWLLFNPSTYG